MNLVNEMSRLTGIKLHEALKMSDPDLVRDPYHEQVEYMFEQDLTEETEEDDWFLNLEAAPADWFEPEPEKVKRFGSTRTKALESGGYRITPNVVFYGAEGYSKNPEPEVIEPIQTEPEQTKPEILEPTQPDQYRLGWLKYSNHDWDRRMNNKDHRSYRPWRRNVSLPRVEGKKIPDFILDDEIIEAKEYQVTLTLKCVISKDESMDRQCLNCTGICMNSHFLEMEDLCQ